MLQTTTTPQLLIKPHTNGHRLIIQDIAPGTFGMMQDGNGEHVTFVYSDTQLRQLAKDLNAYFVDRPIAIG